MLAWEQHPCLRYRTNQWVLVLRLGQLFPSEDCRQGASTTVEVRIGECRHAVLDRDAVRVRRDLRFEGLVQAAFGRARRIPVKQPAEVSKQPSTPTKSPTRPRPAPRTLSNRELDQVGGMGAVRSLGTRIVQF